MGLSEKVNLLLAIFPILRGTLNITSLCAGVPMDIHFGDIEMNIMNSASAFDVQTTPTLGPVNGLESLPTPEPIQEQVQSELPRPDSTITLVNPEQVQSEIPRPEPTITLVNPEHEPEPRYSTTTKCMVGGAVIIVVAAVVLTFTGSDFSMITGHWPEGNSTIPCLSCFGYKRFQPKLKPLLPFVYLISLLLFIYLIAYFLPLHLQLFLITKLSLKVVVLFSIIVVKVLFSLLVRLEKKSNFKTKFVGFTLSGFL